MQIGRFLYIWTYVAFDIFTPKWMKELKYQKVTYITECAGDGRFTYKKFFLKILTMPRFHFIPNFSLSRFALHKFWTRY